MRKRAERVDQTRQRIIEAAVHLHGSIGPAATTIAGIAALANVTRLTVYRHFPDDQALFDACSAHWLSQQDLPDPHAWTRVADPAQRMRAGLADLYRFYRAGEPMLTLVHRDRAALPDAHRRALDEQERLHTAILLEPFPGAKGKQLRAVVAHAVSFWTWRSLCVTQGLSNRDAVSVMTTLAMGVGE
ncbi:TetR/AcrR family transcriptional regulator [Allorhizocola rhizosphaerae]|uniref:TetR/AcrR family transcriptional regulator n=1 Tax=Allorhizocola rhizosphaerae TaxID=1872709 RepID=UPI000E3E3E84|nr:TetR/AcrR family transcriptional regulator [Allorhizocola rhizosphaerae]